MPRAIACGKHGNALTFLPRSMPMARPQREPRDAGCESAHKPVLFCFRCAINNVESLFQLFEQSRDFFGRMLQIVIHRHDHIVFCRADAAEQRVMLAIVAHQIQTAHRREA